MHGMNVVRLNRGSGQIHRTRRAAMGTVATIALAAVGMAFTGPALAQEQAPDADEGFAIEEIIVTSQRRETALQDTPIAMSVFSDKMLAESNIENIDQIQFFMPGMTIANDLFAIVFIRGVGSSALGIGVDPTVTMHFDGVYIPRTSAVYADFWDVERIEVLKGPQGTLYGRNTTGGTLNIISKMPTEELEVSGNVTIGNYKKRRFDATIAGPLSDNILARLTVTQNDQDGYQRDIDRDQRRYQDEDTFAVRGTVLFNLSDRVDLVLRGDYLLQRETGGTFIQDDLNVEGDLYDVSLDGPAAFDIDAGGVSATLSVNMDALGGVTWQTIGAWRKTDVSFALDNDGTGEFRRNAFVPEESETFQLETQLLSTSDSRLEWIAGLFFFREKANDGFNVITLPGGPQCQGADFPDPDPAVCPVGTLAFPSTNTTNAYAAFGQASYNVTDQWRVTAGLRYSWEEKDYFSDFLIDGASCCGPLSGPDDFRFEHASFSSWTPKFIVDYHVSEDIMFWASVSKGFKSGAFGIANLGAGPVEPEILWAYEGGIKSTLMDGRLTANLSGFIWNFTNLQVQENDPVAMTFFLVNAGKTSNDGVELELVARPVEGLDLSFAAAYLDAVYDFFPTTRGDFTGNTINDSPKWSFAGSMAYTVPVGNELGFVTARGGLTWKDKYFYRNDNILIHDSTTQVNASLSFATSDERWRFIIFGTNLTNEVRFNSRGDVQGRFTQRTDVRLSNVGEPREWGFQIQYTY